MSFEFRPPVRGDEPVLVGIAGPSGGGKTYSSLRLARGLSKGEPFAFIDTENGRGLHYADFFPEMRHADLTAPFSPARYAEAITAADEQGFPVIVVDSTSHIWEGEGGVLDMQVEEFARMGNRESARGTSWIAPKTAHKKFVNRTLLRTKAHVILCMRASDQIEFVKVNGKTEVRAKETLTSILGWVPICERRLPFELTMSFLVTPDAPGVPKPVKLQEQHRPFFPLDAPISEDAGRRLAEWAAGGLTEPDQGELNKRAEESSGLSLGQPGVDGEPTRSHADPSSPPGSVSPLDQLIATFGRDEVKVAYREVFPTRNSAAGPLSDVEVERLADHLKAPTLA